MSQTPQPPQPAQPSQSPQPRAERIDLISLEAEAATQQRAGAIGSLIGADLNVNLVRLSPGETVEAHINSEVDVLLVGISGAGIVELEAGDERLDTGSAVYVPKGLRRGIRAGSQGVTYLTCHRRRGLLMPTRQRR